MSATRLIQRRRRSGFTIAELMTSMFIMTLILVPCGLSIVLGVRAMNNAGATTASNNTNVGSSSQTALARVCTEQIMEDVKMATAFSEQTASAITFTVPDRTGDSVAETIRYAWSGAGGATIIVGGTVYNIAPNTLTRQFNGSAPAVMSDNVQAFSFNYLSRTVGSSPEPVATYQ
jgi:Tfp pilus assembly protein PilW